MEYSSIMNPYAYSDEEAVPAGPAGPASGKIPHTEHTQTVSRDLLAEQYTHSLSLLQRRMAALSDRERLGDVGALRLLREVMRDAISLHQVICEAGIEKNGTPSTKQSRLQFGSRMSAQHIPPHAQLLGGLAHLARFEGDVFSAQNDEPGFIGTGSQNGMFPNTEGFGMHMLDKLTAAMEKQGQKPTDPVAEALRHVSQAKDANMDPETIAALEEVARQATRESITAKAPRLLEAKPRGAPPPKAETRPAPTSTHPWATSPTPDIPLPQMSAAEANEILGGTYTEHPIFSHDTLPPR